MVKAGYDAYIVDKIGTTRDCSELVDVPNVRGFSKESPGLVTLDYGNEVLMGCNNFYFI